MLSRMAQNHPLVMRVMASSIAIAEKAGEVIRDIMLKGDLNVVDKGSKMFDPQTEADRQCQLLIVGSLLTQYKKLTIIGEEGKTDLSSVPLNLITKEISEEFLESHKCPDGLLKVEEEEITVWVDPLDGTSEFVDGLIENVTVLIGLAFNDGAIGGIIHQPFFKCQSTGKSGRTIWGLKGLGTGGYTKVAPPADKLILTTTRSHSNEIVKATINAVKPDEVLKVGGCGFKVLQLLEGKAHCYVFASAGCKKWDTCSPESILEADGGVLTDIRGDHYTYGPNIEYLNRTGVLATAPGVDHKDILDKIPSSVKETLGQKK